MGKFVTPQQPVPQLTRHPNFQLPVPRKRESLVAYTLRCAAMLISPPKVVGEDEETPCEVIAHAVRKLAPAIQRRWRESHELYPSLYRHRYDDHHTADGPGEG